MLLYGFRRMRRVRKRAVMTIANTVHTEPTATSIPTRNFSKNSGSGILSSSVVLLLGDKIVVDEMLTKTEVFVLRVV